jgi:hypothetical protein
VAKDRENKKKRLKKARETDRKEKKAKKEAVFRSHAAKEQDKILKNIRITRSTITIDNEDERITIDDLLFPIDDLPLPIDDLPPVDDLPSPSTAPATLGNRSKRARAGTIDYRALAGLSRTREEIERLNQEAERKKKAKATEIALRSPVKKKSRFVNAKAFEKK